MHQMSGCRYRYESLVARALKMRSPALLWEPVLDDADLTVKPAASAPATAPAAAHKAAGSAGSGGRSLPPPLSLAEFREKVGALAFTDGADREAA